MIGNCLLALVDRREGSCYMHGPETGISSCTGSFRSRMSRSMCCCGVGVGWGQNPGACEACASRSSEEYGSLCPGESLHMVIYLMQHID